MTTADIVCTTIGDGSFLKHYAAALAGAEDRARMIVIPDRKTPAALYAAVAEARSAGLNVLCPDLNEQEQFLASLGAPAGMFGWDTDHRRNIGYLMAWRDGADIMISVDDDNLPGEGWLAEHEIVTAPPAGHEVISGRDGYWNPCTLVWNYAFWPRGYPYSHRWRFETPARSRESREIAINEGLWAGDPDVDAITRLAMQPETDMLDGSEILAPDTWAPVNSQNTAIRRDVIPAYYFFRSGRFGDIYQGYLAQACAKAMGHSVRFGTPVVTHARNDHDLLRDLQLELPDILILDGWLDWLTDVAFAGGTYAGNYEYLSGMLRNHAEFGATSADAKRTFHSMASQMTQWLRLIRTIGD
jgi:hypothetical protein